MKALTICQPYAHLIIHGEKRCENRTWALSHPVDLLIHAGKSKAWMRPGDFTRFGRPLTFGALVGIATVAACYEAVNVGRGEIPERHHWLMRHEHAHGPYCFVLENVRRFSSPIPYRGAQGLFEVPEKVFAGAALLEVPAQ